MPIVLKQQHKVHEKAKNFQQDNIKNVLQALKQQTQQDIDNQTIKDIKNAIKSKQSLVYQLVLLQPLQYIAHQFTKNQDKNAKNQSISDIQLLTQKFLIEHQFSKNKASTIVIKNLSSGQNQQNLYSLNKQLRQKLAQVQQNLDSLPSKKLKSSNQLFNRQKMSKSLSFSLGQSPFSTQAHKKMTQNQINNLIQFKQPSYWLKTQQKTQKIKQFLQHHQNQNKKIHKRHQQSIQKSLRKTQQQKDRQRAQKQQKISSILQKGRQKLLEYRDRRQTTLQNHQSKLQEIQQFLQKINHSSNNQQKRLYQQLQQQYQQALQQQKEKRKQVLDRIREEHLPFDKDLMDQHLSKYEQYKQSLKEQLKTKKEEIQQHQQQVVEELKAIFKSKRYQQIAAQNTNDYKRSLSQMKQLKSKKRQFSQIVVQKFKPTVNKKKRRLLEENIKQLILSQDKTKRKTYKNGSIVYEDKVQIDGRKKGVEYLAYLKKYLQDKPKKQARPLSTSVAEIKQKKFDYLRQNKPNVKFKASMIEWQKVIDDKSFQAKDKYTFLKQSINTLQHKAFEKQIQARNLKKSAQQLEKKDQFDKLYMQSIQAKMAILNELMLKK